MDGKERKKQNEKKYKLMTSNTIGSKRPTKQNECVFKKKKWDGDDEIQREIPRKIDQKPATIPPIGDDKK